MDRRTVIVVCQDTELGSKLARTLVLRGLSVLTGDPPYSPPADCEEPSRFIVAAESLVDAERMLRLRRAGPEQRVALVCRSDQLAADAERNLAGFVGLLRIPWNESELDLLLERLLEESPAKGRQIELAVDLSAEALQRAVEAVISLFPPEVDERTLRSCRLALQEAIRNAIEHGCLGIDSNEKAALQEAGTFDFEVERRSAEAKKAGKQVRVTAGVHGAHFWCTITDQGEGFDWRSHAATPQAVQDLTQPHGRGLMLIRHFFDSVEYNERGNAVTLSKRLEAD